MMKIRLLSIHNIKFLSFGLIFVLAYLSSIFLYTPIASAQATRGSALCYLQRDLKLGMIGDDVKALQKYLNQTDFPLALSGVGSVGLETNFFGPLTQTALVKFQKSLGLTDTLGVLEKNNKYFTCSADMKKELEIFSFQRDLKLGMIGDDVKALQKYLNQTDFPLALSGVGSVGLETNFFGPLTQTALVKFQKNKLANILDAQVLIGELGSLFINTRNFINNKFDFDSDIVIDRGDYSIGGAITGLVSEVVLKNNNTDTLTLHAGDNSNFIFAQKLFHQDPYHVTIESKDPLQRCYLHNNIGVVNNANITNVGVACGLNLYYNPFVYRPARSSVATYTLEYIAADHGSISGESSQRVNRGADGSAVTAIADTGYSFVNWSDASTANPRIDTNVSGDISVTANFAINTYTITFDKNTGDTEANPTTRVANYNTTITLPVAPTKVGHTFNGWNTQADGGGSTFDATTAVIADDTVYAQWTALACGDYTVVLDEITYGTVATADGECWLDRNLGASRVANAASDSQAYGYLYQWGRLNDGHQVITSATTATLSASNDHGHGDFITTSAAPHDWRSPANNDLWQGLSGTNNVCPSGFRLPTRAEWTAVLSAENITSIATAYSSALKLTLNGYRDRSNGIIYDQSVAGNYWSSSVSGVDALLLFYDISGVAAPSSAGSRAYGLGVRCIRD